MCVKINFDPRKNITALDCIVAQIYRVQDLLTITKIIKNWYKVLLFRLGLTRNFVMTLRSGEKINISNFGDYSRFWCSRESQTWLLCANNLEKKIRVENKRKIITVQFKSRALKFYYTSLKQLVNAIALLKEQFVKDQYWWWLDARGKYVIDIGANIGDTAIYFTLKGAKHVYAFEPYPYSYKLAIKNMILNNLQDKITLLNEACGGKTGFIKIMNNYENTSGSDLRNFNIGKRIRITTLKEIVAHFNINNNAILKVDCEGCEYGIILNAKDETLRKFDQIMIEYHYGYKNLKRKLELAGFKVKNAILRYTFNPESENPNMIVGFIYARKR